MPRKHLYHRKNEFQLMTKETCQCKKHHIDREIEIRQYSLSCPVENCMDRYIRWKRDRFIDLSLILPKYALVHVQVYLLFPRLHKI